MTNWVPVAEAARRATVRPETIRVWVTRGLVKSVGTGSNRHVNYLDVAKAEAAWRKRLAKHNQSRKPPDL